MIKFSIAGAGRIAAPDAVNLTWPASGWTVGFVLTVGSTTTGVNAQYILSNGAFASAGSMNLAWLPSDYATTAQAEKIVIYDNTTGSVATPSILSTNKFTTGTYFIVVDFDGTTQRIRSCPILSSSPVDGSAVISQGSVALSGAQDGTGPMTIGCRSDLNAGRYLDQSLGRLFRYDGILTDAEVAQLAYGKEITDIGKTPAFYVKMANATDTADRGSLAVPFAAAGTLADATEPGYGYVPGQSGTAPAYTTPPSISGTPTVGTATTFTASVVTGNPTPTKTWQWTLDGSNVSGATSSSYTPITADIGKTLRVVETATNATSPAATSTSNGVAVVAAAPANTAPTITSPSITGTPTVGSASGFTSGTITGNPTPTSTQQWKVDGVNVATTATYTPVTADSGKTLTVTQTATNSVSSASATSAGVVIAAATGNLIDVTQVTAERIYQRINGSANVSINGTYTTADPSSVEVQLYDTAGTSILLPWIAVPGIVIGSGSFAGTLSVPQGGMYRLCVRIKSGATVLATSVILANLFGVGDIIAHDGSSSCAKWFDPTSGSFTPSANVRKHMSGVWAKFTTSNGGVAVQMANYYANLAGVPIGMLGYGISGTKLSEWLNTSGTQWTPFASAVAAVGGKLKACVTTMGGNDAAAVAGVVSVDQHLANLRQHAANVRALVNDPNLPILISGSNGRSGGLSVSATVAVTQYNIIRAAERLAGNDPNILFSQAVDLPLTTDDTHLTVAGFTTSGTRTQSLLGSYLYEGGIYKRGPQVTSMVYAGSTVYVNFVHGVLGNDYTLPAIISGITATDNTGALTVSSSAKYNNSTVAVTFDRAIVAPLSLQIWSGNRPDITGPLLDTESIPLPIEVELSMVPRASLPKKFQGYMLSGARLVKATSQVAGTSAIVLNGTRTGKIIPGDTLV